jgi:anaerobic nitric oxide reductase transcription regulator
VRLVVATNRDLATQVREGRMRADIYHRLSVYPLRVPPLRERSRDVLLLSGFFLEENRGRLGVGSLRLDPGAQEALMAYDWPGNVRELEHLIGRSVLKSLARHSPRPPILTLSAIDLGLTTQASSLPVPWASELGSKSEEPLGLRGKMESIERQLIEECLQRHGKKWAPAARELKMDPANLVRLAKRLGVRD